MIVRTYLLPMLDPFDRMTLLFGSLNIVFESELSDSLSERTSELPFCGLKYSKLLFCFPMTIPFFHSVLGYHFFFQYLINTFSTIFSRNYWVKTGKTLPISNKNISTKIFRHNKLLRHCTRGFTIQFNSFDRLTFRIFSAELFRELEIARQKYQCAKLVWKLSFPNLKANSQEIILVFKDWRLSLFFRLSTNQNSEARLNNQSAHTIQRDDQ